MTPASMRPILLVSRFDDCFRFYRDTMGFKVSWGKEGGGYATFVVRRNRKLSIFDRGQMAKTIGNDSLPSESTSQDRLALTFEVQDIDRTIKSLKKKGAKFITSIIDKKDWGIRTIFLRDPDGNLLQIESEMPRDQWTAGLQEESKLYRPDV